VASSKPQLAPYAADAAARIGSAIPVKSLMVND
jgi:hypothetical protein